LLWPWVPLKTMDFVPFLNSNCFLPPVTSPKRGIGPFDAPARPEVAEWNSVQPIQPAPGNRAEKYRSRPALDGINTPFTLPKRL